MCVYSEKKRKRRREKEEAMGFEDHKEELFVL